MYSVSFLTHGVELETANLVWMKRFRKVVSFTTGIVFYYVHGVGKVLFECRLGICGNFLNFLNV